MTRGLDQSGVEQSYLLGGHAGDDARERGLAQGHVSAADVPDGRVGAFNARAGIGKRTGSLVKRAESRGVRICISACGRNGYAQPSDPNAASAAKSGTLRAALMGSFRSGRHITESASAASATLRVSGPTALKSGLSPMPGTRPLVGLMP